MGFKEEDIDGDFDPKKYDEAMEVLSNSVKRCNYDIFFSLQEKYYSFVSCICTYALKLVIFKFVRVEQ